VNPDRIIIAVLGWLIVIWFCTGIAKDAGAAAASWRYAFSGALHAQASPP
jgi:hypothetical protein